MGTTHFAITASAELLNGAHSPLENPFVPFFSALRDGVFKLQLYFRAGFRWEMFGWGGGGGGCLVDPIVSRLIFHYFSFTYDFCESTLVCIGFPLMIFIAVICVGHYKIELIDILDGASMYLFRVDSVGDVFQKYGGWLRIQPLCSN